MPTRKIRRFDILRGVDEGTRIDDRTREQIGFTGSLQFVRL